MSGAGTSLTTPSQKWPLCSCLPPPRRQSLGVLPKNEAQDTQHVSRDSRNAAAYECLLGRGHDAR